MARDFAAEATVLRRELEGSDRWAAVDGLRELEEAWARAWLGLGRGGLARGVRERVERPIAAEALEQAALHLAEAERWQREIASCATSGSEGLAAMVEVRELQMARAWVAFALARATGAAEHVRAVDRLIAEVAADGKSHASDIRTLRAWAAAR